MGVSGMGEILGMGSEGNLGIDRMDNLRIVFFSSPIEQLQWQAQGMVVDSRIWFDRVLFSRRERVMAWFAWI